MRFTYILDAYPVLTETFVENEIAVLREQGHTVHLEPTVRTNGPAKTDSAVQRLLALCWCVMRHPRVCAHDARSRRRWRDRGDDPRTLRELAPVALRVVRRRSEHLHAHFAAGAALDACRIAALTGLPWSFTAHAYDIFKTPRNLSEKLQRADVAVTVCEYNRRHLEKLTDRPIETVLMGVDLERFRRSGPPKDERVVLAVGRLVAKKGFDVLVQAAALSIAERVVIAGEGPDRARLERLADELGLGDRVSLVGARSPAEIKVLLEEADVLAMPSVIASDGDRDSMPVVVKEAMAMEVPVVASDAVGLPEIVEAPWGRLVAPGDASALAAALDEVLGLPVTGRAELGRRAREVVAARADVRRETARLARLLGGGHDLPA